MTEWSLFISKAKFSITVIQVHATTSNYEETEAEQFYERPTRTSGTNTKKDVLFTTADWNEKVGSQELPGVTGKLELGIQNEG